MRTHYCTDVTEKNIDEIKNKLRYPGNHHQNPLYKIFDQLFYGPELYEKLFQNKSEFSEPGLIKNDVIIVNKSLIFKLKLKYESKISIVTGRGLESLKYSLKNLLKEFDIKWKNSNEI